MDDNVPSHGRPIIQLDGRLMTARPSALMMEEITVEGSSMNAPNSAGERLRAAVEQERPLQVVGVINAYAARLAQATGFRALYISGGGVAASSCGIPDLGITTREDVLTDVRRVVEISDLPVLVDIDTGWGGAFSIARTIKSMERAGVAGVHIEDQVSAKRCGHRPGKAVVPAEEMVDRIRAAVNARTDAGFVVMARTDALAVEGLDAAIGRACRYVEAGAEMLFPEGLRTLAQYQRFVDAVRVPVLANITEFGVTPLLTVEELRSVGVRLVLYPLSAFRAMSAAALQVYQALRRDGTQQHVIGQMQTREDLYRYLGYHAMEQEQQ
jgi:methylisocitrate lyase